MEIKRILKGLAPASGRFIVVLVCVLMIAAAGCSKKEEKAPKATGGEEQAQQATPADQQAAGKAATDAVGKGSALPPEHPPMDQMADAITKASHASIKTQKEITLSKEVAEKWKEVELEITDNAARRTEVVKLNVGSLVQLTDEGHKLRIEVFVPDYAISENKISSRSNEANNPAVLVELLEGDKSIARGWVFKHFPEFNSYNDQRFNLVLVGPSAEGGPGAK